MAKKPEIRRVDTDHRFHKVRTTQIEIRKDCKHCGQEYWAKSSKSKFCTPACRLLNHLAGKKEKPAAKIPTIVKPVKKKKK